MSVDSSSITTPRRRVSLQRTRYPGIYRRAGANGTTFKVRYSDSYGKVHEATARTLGEARQLRSQLQVKRDAGALHTVTHIKLRDYVPKWAASYNGRTDNGIRPETLADYVRDLELHVLPTLGHRRLADIRPRDIKELREYLKAKPRQGSSARRQGAGLSPSSIRNAIAALRVVLATAVEDEYISVNPARGIRLGSTPSTGEAHRTLSEYELKALVAAAPDSWRRTLLLLVSETGLRISEVLALRWDDHENLNGTPSIRVRARLYKDRIDKPKTANGTRTIPISSNLDRRLKADRMATLYKQPDDFIFTTMRGTHQRPENLRRHVLDPAATIADIDPFGWHTLRHTAVTRWFRAGIEPKKIQVLAGHHSVAFTLTAYTHLLPSDLPDTSVFDGLALEAGP